jgi:DNA helicase-2/ATP-dependent DNA helicase PcrA
MTQQKPRLVLAGPGAGKTHGMVDEIIAALDRLAPQRHLAAITYTNAAANMIRDDLCRRVPARRNVFIGTTHSFISRFILQPFATVFEKLPPERTYGAIDVYDMATKGGTKKLDLKRLHGAASGIRKALLAKGVVPYDAMLAIAEEILEHKMVRTLVARRLQFLFVDEFQDTDTRQLKSFDALRGPSLTGFYAVGDPEQYIMGFTYGQRRQPAPAYSKLPFFQFQQKAEVSKLPKNRRANGELVAFAQQFRDDLSQEPEKPRRGSPRALYLALTDITEIITEFRGVSAHIEREESRPSRLYLSAANKTLDNLSIRMQFGIIPVSNTSRKSPTLLGDALDFLALALGRSQRRVQEDFQLSPLEWRRAGVTLLRKAREESFDDRAFVMFVKEEFRGEEISDSRIQPIQDALLQLQGVIAAGLRGSHTERCSSIHRAKGLEADAVLVLAMTPSELAKWLTIDRAARCEDRRDMCRLGYVAFTRAREMLCLACLRPLDDTTRQSVIDRGITISPSSG